MALGTDSTSAVVGLDGYRDGWLGAIWRGPGSAPIAVTIPALADAQATLPPDTHVIAIDIPLGLPEIAVHGGRECDQQARKLIGPRGSSVFPAPTKIALSAPTNYAEASRLNRASSADAIGISKQCFALFPKLIEANGTMSASQWLRERTIEVHPEVSFRIAAGSTLAFAKRKLAGRRERHRLLDEAGFVEIEAFVVHARRLGAEADDALDACIAAWSAWRRLLGQADCLPANTTGPDHEYRIWY